VIGGQFSPKYQPELNRLSQSRQTPASHPGSNFFSCGGEKWPVQAVNHQGAVPRHPWMPRQAVISLRQAIS
jgi:hypothetical protein